MKKILGMLGLLAGALVSAATAFAGPLVTDWQYTESLAWQTPVFSSGGGNQVSNATTLSWGQNGGSTALGGTRSSLVITNTPVAGHVFTNLAPVATNTITHTNNSIDGSFATLLSADLHNTLTLTPFAPAAGPTIPSQIDFLIHFKETPNSAPCGFVSSTTCDDIFVIDSGALNNKFTYDGNQYFVSITTTTGALTPLSPAACSVAGVAAGCLGFITRENAATPVTFQFQITAQPVTIPEPGELALLAIGLLGLYFARNRKSLKL